MTWRDILVARLALVLAAAASALLLGEGLTGPDVRLCVEAVPLVEVAPTP